jgi:hypothetical protein
MSCGCSNTSSITPTTNCGSCGYNCTNCTCSTNPIITPAVVCADPEPCSELFPLECVIYTGPDITCAGTANTLYPALFHYLVLQNASTTSRNFVSILNNINSQLCYLFSKEYILQFLTNIQDDPVLTQLFCDIASSCNCICTLTCPSITNVVYINNTSPTNDLILAGGFTASTLGSTISFTGSITGTTLTINTAPSSPGTIQAGQKINGTGVLPNTYITSGSASTWTINNAHSQPISSVSMTASQIEYIVSIYRYFNSSFYYLTQSTFTGNPLTMTLSIELPSQYDNSQNLPWLMSVQAVDKIADMLGNPPCTKGYNNPISNVAVDPSLYVNGYLSCGFGQTIPSIPSLQCPNICISNFNGSMTYSNFKFQFTEPAANPALYHPNSYTIHWYKEINGVFTMQNTATDIISVVSVAPSYQLTIDTTVLVNSADTWAFLITPVFTEKSCNTASYFEVRRPPLSYRTSELIDKDCNVIIQTFTPAAPPPVPPPSKNCPNCLPYLAKCDDQLNCTNNYWSTHTSGSKTYLKFTFYHNIFNQVNVWNVNKYWMHCYKRESGNTISNSVYRMPNAPGAGGQYNNQYIGSQGISTLSIAVASNTLIELGNQPEQWLILVTAEFTTPGSESCNLGEFDIRPPSTGLSYLGSELINKTCKWFIYNIG